MLTFTATRNLLQCLEGVWTVIDAIIHAMDCHHYLQDIASKIKVLSSSTLEERAGADLGVSPARFAVMPKCSFDICLVILVLDDFVDGFFDLVEVLLVLESERLVLNKVSVQQQTSSAISTWSQGE